MTRRTLAATLALTAALAAAYMAGVVAALCMGDEWDECLEAGAL